MPVTVGSAPLIVVDAAGWQLALNVAALALFIGFLLMISFRARQDPDSESGILASLAGTAALMPVGVAEIGTVAAYIAPQAGLPPWSHSIHALALSMGIGLSIIAWLMAALAFKPLSRADRQNASVFADLSHRYTELAAEINAFCPVDQSLGAEAVSACTAARSQCDDLGRQLGITSAEPAKGLRWVLSTGYISLWSRLHRAEENLFMVAPVEEVEADALYDYSRIQGSNIPNSEQLLARLRWAVSILNPIVAQTITPPGTAIAIPQPEANQPSAGQTRLRWVVSILKSGGAQSITPPGTAIANRQPGANQPSAGEARAILRALRRTLNEYRDGLWDGIVRQKNHLVEAVIFTQALSFSLLGLLIITGLPIGALTAAVVFYLVGGLAGLFNRLRPGSNGPGTDQPVEDYGLSSTTLLQTPLFSGLAAVGGVLFTALLTVVVDTTSLTPGGKAVVPNLVDVFDLYKYQFGLVTAAVFGLTPQLLLARLQAVSNKYKGDINSTQAASGNQH